MAIHPNYAEAILAGTKRVEFRKRRLAADVTTVLIYATSPVQRIVGEFRIRDTVVDTPRAIWDSYGHVGVIDEDDFESYYGESGMAVALVVDRTRRYSRPRPLTELDPEPSIPQSFSYVARPKRRRSA